MHGHSLHISPQLGLLQVRSFSSCSACWPRLSTPSSHSLPQASSTVPVAAPALGQGH